MLTATYGWNAWAAMLAGVLAAALIGLVASVPGLRVGGWYFALTSLFIATVIPQTVKIIPKPTGGEFGLAGIDRPTVLGHALSTPALYALSLVLLGLSLLGLRNLTRSTWGLAFACLRRGDICLRSVGVSPTRVRLTIYLLAAVLAGVGGAVYPFLDGFISPDAFPLSLSILIIGATIIGGSDAVWAPVIGVAILQFVPEVSDRFDKYALLIYGLALVLGSLLLPRGLVVPLRRGASALLAAAARPGAGTGGGTGTGGVPAGGTGSADAAVARLTGAADPGAVLEVAGLGKAFGGNQAVADVSFTARPGQITAVIGANGCGKTTTLNLISGFYRADRGRVGVGGTPLEGRAPHRVVRERVSRTFQTPLLLPDRTVLENVMAGMLTRTPVGAATAILGLPAARRARAGFAADAADLLAFMRPRAPRRAGGRHPQPRTAAAAGGRPGAEQARPPSCCWTSPPPGWSAPRSTSWPRCSAPCAARASRSCWSSTTCGWSWASPTTSSSSTPAPSSPPGPRTRSGRTPRWRAPTWADHAPRRERDCDARTGFARGEPRPDGGAARHLPDGVGRRVRVPARPERRREDHRARHRRGPAAAPGRHADLGGRRPRPDADAPADLARRLVRDGGPCGCSSGSASPTT